MAGNVDEQGRRLMMSCGRRMTSLQAISSRKQQVLDAIGKTGTYEHTVDELQWGIRVAWRNAAKCANRKFWDEIMLLDYRHAQTPADMFEVRLSAHTVVQASFAVFYPRSVRCCLPSCVHWGV